VRLGRRPAAPQDVQVLERRQILHLAQHGLIRVQWNGFVELLPMWIAPNLVTLLGFFFILGNVILLEIYIPDLVGPVSRQ
jgi:hypothetical protein